MKNKLLKSFILTNLFLLIWCPLAESASVKWHAEAETHGIVSPGKKAHIIIKIGDIEKEIILENHGRFEYWDRKTKGGEIEIDLQEIKAVVVGDIGVGSSYSLTLEDTIAQTKTTGTAPISGAFEAWANYDNSAYDWTITMGGHMDEPIYFYQEGDETGYATLGDFSFTRAPAPSGYPDPYLTINTLDTNTLTGEFEMLEYLYLVTDNLWLEDESGNKSYLIMESFSTATLIPEPASVLLLLGGTLILFRK